MRRGRSTAKAQQSQRRERSRKRKQSREQHDEVPRDQGAWQPPALSKEQREVFTEEAAVEAAVQRFLGVLQWKASRMDGVDPDLADDLVQEALIRLWELGPSRFEEREANYVRSVLIGHMHARRAEEWQQGRGDDVRIHLRTG